MVSEEAERVTRKKALHKKSRDGCSRCKSRRVKCDEQRPCRNCMRRGEECDLILPNTVRAMMKCSGCNGPSASLDWGREVYLMNFYTLQTAETVVPFGQATKIFQVWLPQLALNKPHLMRGLLAFAAFHLAYLRPEEASQWVPIAIKNQTAALISFRKTIELGSPQQDTSLWAVATILGTSSLAYLAASIYQGSIPTIPDVIQTFLLLRGISYVSQPLTGPSRDSRLLPILDGYHIETCIGTNPPSEASHQLEQIKSMIDETSQGLERQHLLKAHRYLKLVYAEVAYTKGTANRNPILVWKWSSMVSNGYVALLKGCNLPALVIFAHFTLLSRVFRETWFLQGWASQTIAAIKSSLPPSWAHWISWPEQQLKNELQAFQNDEGVKSPKWVVEPLPTNSLMNGTPEPYQCMTLLSA